MSITLMTLKLTDIFESKDNPRGKDDFGNIKELAATFAANSERPGEPFTPIMVLKVDQKFQLLDGARRFRAMKLIKTKECQAYVVDGEDSYTAVLTAIATDAKVQLSAASMSHAVQTALLLGIDPDTVGKASRNADTAFLEKVGSVIKERKVYPQLTLERLAAIGEAEDFGLDAEVITKLEDPELRNYRYVLETAKREKVCSDLFAMFSPWCESLGVDITLDDSIYYSPKGLTKVADKLTSKSKLTSAIKSLGNSEVKGLVLSISVDYDLAPRVVLYRPTLAAESQEQALKVQRAAERDEKKAKKRREAWIVERINDWETKLSNTIAALFCAEDADGFPWRITDGITKIKDNFEIDVPVIVSPTILAICYNTECFRFSLPDIGLIFSESSELYSFQLDGLCRFTNNLKGMMLDGYEPDEAERALLELIAKTIAAHEQDLEVENEKEE